ncbi:Hint domain-containing protein [Paracoccus sp. MBLB3053]|uniref:Hint domain-containing protein n=1 Tax=Paracoccus aurantius TaxID=3073814 RepID=A0ABU2HXJ9_9RHOB|nr:Hint domain-containing protein [Paracoccus sp. MBLB3053]MDS9469784.1 Hint domain-containing protein [Paracoccus sp. MBLB3053]
MAQFDFLSIIAFTRSGNSLNFGDGTTYDVEGTLDDGDSADNSFQDGEIVGTVDGNAVRFIGTYTYNGHVYPVVTIDGNPDSGYLVSPYISATSLSDLPNEVSTNDVEFNAASAGDFVTCFAAGTLVRTPVGETAVEALRIGDLIMTDDGRSIPVRWIGRQTVDKRFTPTERFVPVRVRAGALGGGIPHSDLVLTADHALILDGIAINASALVNGRTIAYEPSCNLPDRITYYHVETEGHEIIVANGVAAETYVDYITRRVFDNYAEFATLYGEDRTIAEMSLPRVSSARLLPPPIRARLAAICTSGHRRSA